MNKISLVGCGFIGSHLAEEFSKIIFSQNIQQTMLNFIDFDTWEDRNASNQNVSFLTAARKEFKSATCREYAEHYGIMATSSTEKLTPYNAIDSLKDSILVIDSVDNLETRQLLNMLASGGQIPPCMHVGISRKGEGLINWSSTLIDTFPFKLQNTAGRVLQEQDIKEPPCVMYKYRVCGLYLVQAAAKAFAYFLGKDPWLKLSEEEEIPTGTITCWMTSPDGKETLMVEDMYLNRDKNYFPMFDLEELKQGKFDQQKQPQEKQEPVLENKEQLEDLVEVIL